MRASLRLLLLPVVWLLLLAGCSQGISDWQASPGSAASGTLNEPTTQPLTTRPASTQPPVTQPSATQPTSQPALTTQPTSQPALTTQPTSQPALTTQPTSQPALTTQPTSQPTLRQPTSQPTFSRPTSQPTPSQPVAGSAAESASSATPSLRRASNAKIVERSTIPVLCWHQIRNHRPSDSAYARTLITPPRLFAEQLAALSAAGYESITPDQLYDYLVYEGALPRKPVLITLDDGWESEWVGAKPALMANNMVATYFITTKGIDYKTWVSSEQLREMRDAGMTIGNHTTSHGDSRHYDDADWKYQLNKSLAKLEQIIGEPVRHFAYPYGAWNSGAFRPLSEAGIKLAFQLTEKPVDKSHPLLTQRRMMVDSRWSPKRMLTIMESVFDEGQNRESNY